ncbi:hypothetical protein FIBSPDRAFT_965850 [Athelia psychrophila]|uniref:Uncharacterized protein n=1 Tax=Athelia psychrophila TaxID=1759441 RepID=A0A167XG08_9AGAM|nr:hypothetical protein FIBSPDRAFT_965850 [Fibularhizoctonia sp. CBS 109695]
MFYVERDPRSHPATVIPKCTQQRHRMPPKAGKKIAPAPAAAGKAKKPTKNPLFEAKAKNFGIGQQVRSQIRPHPYSYK